MGGLRIRPQLMEAGDVVTAAGQLENFFGEAGKEAPEAVIPPPAGAPDPETMKRWSELLEKYSTEVLGPPPSLTGGPQVGGRDG